LHIMFSTNIIIGRRSLDIQTDISTTGKCSL